MAKIEENELRCWRLNTMGTIEVPLGKQVGQCGVMLRVSFPQGDEKTSDAIYRKLCKLSQEGKLPVMDEALNEIEIALAETLRDED